MPFMCPAKKRESRPKNGVEFVPYLVLKNSNLGNPSEVTPFV
jgi:hypothetical protein